MNNRTRPVSPSRRALLILAVGLAFAVIVAFAVQQSLTAASATPTHEISSPGDIDTAPGDISGSLVAPSEADGVIRDGDQPTVFDIDRVAIGNLDPALLEALQRAATGAQKDGVTILVNSGWRSAALQEHMLREAVVQYGSEAEAARWVATAQTSAHVAGRGVDVGPLPTLDWLARHGSDYGLCQIYANESWHYELRPDAVTYGCPEMYNDPTEDPRMQP